MTLLVLHHTDDVGLGALAPALDERQIARRDIDPTATPADLADASGLLVLGGDPGSVPDGEVELVAAALELELPTFGICHGAEVMALALGGSVVRRERPEIGFFGLHRTAPGREDAVAAGWPDGAVAFAMHHGEIAALPKEAETLLMGSDGPSLWRLGSAYGTSLHPEADADTITAWLDADAADAIVAAADRTLEDLRAEVERRRPFLASAGVALLLRWLDSSGITPTD